MLSRGDGGRLAVSSCSFAQLDPNFVSNCTTNLGTTALQSFATHNVYAPNVEILSDHDVRSISVQRSIGCPKILLCRKNYVQHEHLPFEV